MREDKLYIGKAKRDCWCRGCYKYLKRNKDEIVRFNYFDDFIIILCLSCLRTINERVAAYTLEGRNND